MLSPTTGLIFAAGLGQRMHPLTQNRPKALVEVNGKALLDHMLEYFAEAGMRHVFVNVHYLAGQIKAHLSVTSSQNSLSGSGLADMEIFVSDETELLLDQGGAIQKILPHLLRLDQGTPFFIANVDALFSCKFLGGRSVGEQKAGKAENNFTRLASVWDEEQMDILLLLAPKSQAIGMEGAGDFYSNREGKLTPLAFSSSFISKGSQTYEKEGMFYAGLALMKPHIFSDSGPYASLCSESGIFPLRPFFWEAARRGRLYGVALVGTWLHVGTPQALQKAEQFLNDSI